MRWNFNVKFNGVGRSSEVDGVRDEALEDIEHIWNTIFL
jgi:hypothetical protein